MRPESAWFRRLLPALVGALLACNGAPAEHSSVSTKARVRAKTGAVWGQDLALGLGLQPWELCAELGAYDCLGEAHLIALGGVEPTVLGIDEPLPDASASAPIAYDRTAISACAQRYDRDKAGPEVLFTPGKTGPAARREVARSLVRRLLGREPGDAEVAALVDLHDTLAPISTDLDRDWAVGACVMVATSTEALFY